MNEFFDLQKPFYRPLWIRIAVVAVCLGWALVEFASGSAFWGIIVGALGLYAGYQFFIVFNPKPERTADETDRGA